MGTLYHLIMVESREHLEVRRDKNDGCSLFEEETKLYAISAFSTAGISPP